jgi:DNA-binding NarL/FixJ family response regulator
VLSSVIAVTPVTVAVLASDPIVGDGTVAYLRDCPQIRLVPPDRLSFASVVLVMADQVSEETLQLMQEAAGQVSGGEARFVLVCDGIREPQLLRALRWGLVSVLPRREVGYERIVRALVNASEGRGELPQQAQDWLAGRLRAVQRDVLDPHGLTIAGLYAREVDVLRLLAEGMDLGEIAGRLSCSERTVRNIIHGVLSRLKLRNRVHAVAYALRNGAM